MIPDYDRVTQPVEIPKNTITFHHGDVNVESKILRLKVLFKWQPLINETFMETIRQWVVGDQFGKPDFVILSINKLNKSGIR